MEAAVSYMQVSILIACYFLLGSSNKKVRRMKLLKFFSLTQLYLIRKIGFSLDLFYFTILKEWLKDTVYDNR